ncbi:hypothetical protein Tco_0806524 [Tanacetum coccineum]
MVRSMMSLTTLPLSFWDYALESAARILNMVPTKKIDPDRLGPSILKVEEHSLGDLNESANYKAALSDPEFEKWLVAMNEEMQSMNDNKVWKLVVLPPNAKVVKNCEVIMSFLKEKKNPSGNVLGGVGDDFASEDIVKA